MNMNKVVLGEISLTVTLIKLTLTLEKEGGKKDQKLQKQNQTKKLKFKK